MFASRKIKCCAKPQVSFLLSLFTLLSPLASINRTSWSVSTGWYHKTILPASCCCNLQIEAHLRLASKESRLERPKHCDNQETNDERKLLLNRLWCHICWSGCGFIKTPTSCRHRHVTLPREVNSVMPDTFQMLPFSTFIFRADVGT